MVLSRYFLLVFFGTGLVQKERNLEIAPKKSNWLRRGRQDESPIFVSLNRMSNGTLRTTKNNLGGETKEKVPNVKETGA